MLFSHLQNTTAFSNGRWILNEKTFGQQITTVAKVHECRTFAHFGRAHCEKNSKKLCVTLNESGVIYEAVQITQNVALAHTENNWNEWILIQFLYVLIDDDKRTINRIYSINLYGLYAKDNHYYPGWRVKYILYII